MKSPEVVQSKPKTEICKSFWFLETITFFLVFRVVAKTQKYWRPLANSNQYASLNWHHINSLIHRTCRHMQKCAEVSLAEIRKALWAVLVPQNLKGFNTRCNAILLAWLKMEMLKDSLPTSRVRNNEIFWFEKLDFLRRQRASLTLKRFDVSRENGMAFAKTGKTNPKSTFHCRYRRLYR